MGLDLIKIITIGAMRAEAMVIVEPEPGRIQLVEVRRIDTRRDDCGCCIDSFSPYSILLRSIKYKLKIVTYTNCIKLQVFFDFISNFV